MHTILYIAHNEDGFLFRVNRQNFLSETRQKTTRTRLQSGCCAGGSDMKHLASGLEHVWSSVVFTPSQSSQAVVWKPLFEKEKRRKKQGR